MNMNINAKDAGFNSGKYDFVGKAALFFWVTNAALIISLIAIFWKGLNYGIDFKGGTEVQIKFAQELSDDGALRKFLAESGFENAQLQKFGKENEYLIRIDTVQGKDDTETNQLLKERVQKITDGVQASFGTSGPEIRRVDSVGPQVGDQLKRNGILAMFYSLIVILIYVGLRFDYNFAPGAVICLFHDVVIVVGIFALMGKEFNIQILAAILTIIGYDINDTIVIYDRIRENIQKHKGVALSKVINLSINETLSRTIITGGSTLLTSFSLMMFAGGVIEDFAFALIIGVLLGTYSSIYVAAPLIIYFERLRFGKAV